MFDFIGFLGLIWFGIFFQSSRQNYVCTNWIQREHRLHVENGCPVRMRDINY